jgi:hypothetical protein
MARPGINASTRLTTPIFTQVPCGDLTERCKARSRSASAIAPKAAARAETVYPLTVEKNPVTSM